MISTFIILIVINSTKTAGVSLNETTETAENYGRHFVKYQNVVMVMGRVSRVHPFGTSWKVLMLLLEAVRCFLGSWLVLGTRKG